MIRDYTAYYRSEVDPDDTVKYKLGSRTMADATLTALEIKPEGYILHQLLYAPDWK